MGSKRLTRLSELDGDICEKLNNSGLKTCKDVLSKDILELLNICQDYKKVLDVLKIVSNVVAPTPSTVFQLLQKNQLRFLPTNLLSLDHVLHGGLTTGTITEITGPPGCGKTQFCMMMSAITVLSQKICGANGHAVYIDTENAFTGKRLLEIVQHQRSTTQAPFVDVREIVSKVLIYVEPSCKSLMARLEMLEEVIISKDVKLIILDSIASLARKEFGHQAVLHDRNNLLMKQATMLKYFAETFNIAILVTNQITTRFNTDSTDDPSITAALGNTWAHAVNTRLMVQFIDDYKRELTIAKSPIAQSEKFCFSIDAGGIKLA